jgi:hypothetical protein
MGTGGVQWDNLSVVIKNQSVVDDSEYLLNSL